ncbi:hypothetical protein FSP39_003288 [Pinctada imbricata]|uniref:Endonuclease/exonuclease/phosphatase domain-containing protein n=1 Tax=Pinctada imbricata TaxID=66713 RepID=A0AA88XEI5_PINIB|nr:hypothetical protein FSP39_003288 [Pinctada imbricata]
MNSLCAAITDLSNKFPGSVVWISGDANLPDIEWDTMSITGNRNSAPINTAFLTTVLDIGSEQVVNFPTRRNNLLDIFLTNRPSLINKCSPLPGLSDHDVVLIDSNITPARQKPPSRIVHLWKKVDIKVMESDLSHQLESSFSGYSTNTPVDTLWTSFKTTCLNSIQKHVPTKLTSTRYSQPWSNRNIRKLSRRKKRAFKRFKSTRNQKDWNYYQKKQKESNKECKSASVIW